MKIDQRWPEDEMQNRGVIPLRVLNSIGAEQMQEINVAELRKHTKACFDAVEQGDVLRVYRKGRPVAPERVSFITSIILFLLSSISILRRIISSRIGIHIPATINPLRAILLQGFSNKNCTKKSRLNKIVRTS